MRQRRRLRRPLRGKALALQLKRGTEDSLGAGKGLGLEAWGGSSKRNVSNIY